MFASIRIAKSRAKALKRAFAGAGYPQKLTKCQAIVAVSCGFNNWVHLIRTIGTPHAPSVSRSPDEVLKRFEGQVRAALPEGSELDMPRLFAIAFGRPGQQGQAPDGSESPEEAIRTLPVSETLGTVLPLEAIQKALKP